MKEHNNVITGNIICPTINTKDITSKLYSDQTGKFPLSSSRSQKYFFVFYHSDRNAILRYAIKSRTTKDLCKTQMKAYTCYKYHGEAPNLHILDNECSTEMKAMFEQEQVLFQPVPPNIHRQNTAERAIQTYKNHLIAGFSPVTRSSPLKSGTDSFPMQTSQSKYFTQHATTLPFQHMQPYLETMISIKHQWRRQEQRLWYKKNRE